MKPKALSISSNKIIQVKIYFHFLSIRLVFSKKDFALVLHSHLMNLPTTCFRAILSAESPTTAQWSMNQ